MAAQPAITPSASDQYQLRLSRQRNHVHTISSPRSSIGDCDASSTEWQNQMYEHFHADLKRLHETVDVPYFYMEWRAALEIVLPARGL